MTLTFGIAVRGKAVTTTPETAATEERSTTTWAMPRTAGTPTDSAARRPGYQDQGLPAQTGRSGPDRASLGTTVRAGGDHAAGGRRGGSRDRAPGNRRDGSHARPSGAHHASVPQASVPQASPAERLSRRSGRRTADRGDGMGPGLRRARGFPFPAGAAPRTPGGPGIPGPGTRERRAARTRRPGRSARTGTAGPEPCPRSRSRAAGGGTGRCARCWACCWPSSAASSCSARSRWSWCTRRRRCPPRRWRPPRSRSPWSTQATAP